MPQEARYPVKFRNLPTRLDDSNVNNLLKTFGGADVKEMERGHGFVEGIAWFGEEQAAQWTVQSLQGMCIGEMNVEATLLPVVWVDVEDDDKEKKKTEPILSGTSSKLTGGQKRVERSVSEPRGEEKRPKMTKTETGKKKSLSKAMTKQSNTSSSSEEEEEEEELKMEKKKKKKREQETEGGKSTKKTSADPPKSKSTLPSPAKKLDGGVVVVPRAAKTTGVVVAPKVAKIEAASIAVIRAKGKEETKIGSKIEGSKTVAAKIEETKIGSKIEGSKTVAAKIEETPKVVGAGKLNATKPPTKPKATQKAQNGTEPPPEKPTAVKVDKEEGGGQVAKRKGETERRKGDVNVEPQHIKEGVPNGASSTSERRLEVETLPRKGQEGSVQMESSREAARMGSEATTTTATTSTNTTLGTSADIPPPKWEKYWDDNYKAFYFFNPETKTTVWTPPPPGALVVEIDPGPSIGEGQLPMVEQAPSTAVIVPMVGLAPVVAPSPTPVPSLEAVYRGETTLGRSLESRPTTSGVVQGETEPPKTTKARSDSGTVHTGEVVTLKSTFGFVGDTGALDRVHFFHFVNLTQGYVPSVKDKVVFELVANHLNGRIMAVAVTPVGTTYVPRRGSYADPEPQSASSHHVLPDPPSREASHEWTSHHSGDRGWDREREENRARRREQDRSRSYEVPAWARRDREGGEGSPPTSTRALSSSSSVYAPSVRWVRHVDPQTGFPYWFDPDTNQTTWTLPNAS